MADEVKGIDRQGVSDWLAAHIDGARPPFEFSIIAGGHSNLTYRVTDSDGERFVLRRPPLGAVIATAHDMAREHRIISALGPTAVPVPAALGLCEDEAVNGAPFYVMAFVDGHVLVDPGATAELFDLDARAALGQSVIEVLAALHRVDPDETGLGDLGRKEAYLERQLKRWRGQWEKTRTRELPAMDEIHGLLEERRPRQIGASIVHGDYRLGNMLVGGRGGDASVFAVLDWELCTLGDPLADVGYVLNSWSEPGEVDRSGAGDVMAPTSAGGFPSRAEFMARYSQLTGRDVADVDYYRAFQYWRLAAIVEGVLSRYLKGVMANSANTDVFRKQVDRLADSALALLRH